MISYDFINSYIRNTIKKNDGILKELEEFAKEHHVPIVHPEVSSFLNVMVSIIKPRRILEVGTAIGYSSILMAQSLSSDGFIDSIERYELMVDRAKSNIKKAGLSDKINIICGDALEVLSCLNKQYDMIFLDAAKGQYPQFLPHCLRMLPPGGVLISDNVLYKGMIASDELVVRRKKTIVTRMRNYLMTLCSIDGIETSIIPMGDGVAISIKKEEIHYEKS